MDHLRLLERLILREELNSEEAEWFMELMLSADKHDSIKGAALALLKTRLVSGQELAYFAAFIRSRAEKVDVSGEGLLDTCGTGGGAPSFNISTCSAIIAAAAGVPTAKHGNRAVTSQCGSADVLEASGAATMPDPHQCLDMLKNIGITFLYAPAHHPTMKNIGPVRRALGIRTVFNQLGPLANPFGAKRQVLGVYSPELLDSMADALIRLDTTCAAVVHSLDGLDEVSPCAPTKTTWAEGGEIRSETISPESYGLPLLDPQSIQPGDSLEENAHIMRLALSNPDSVRSRAVLPSAAFALKVSGSVSSLKDGAAKAKEVIASGAAIQKLDEIVKYSRESAN